MEGCGKCCEVKICATKKCAAEYEWWIFSFGPLESSYFFNFKLYVSPIEIASHTLILCIFHQLQIPSRHSYGIFLPIRAFFDMN